MKKILTHKILPLVALFLLIFNLFFVGNVKALSSEECGTFIPSVPEKIKSLPEYSEYDHYFAGFFDYKGANRIVVIFFNDFAGRFYIDTYNGVPCLYTTSNFECVVYGISATTLEVVQKYNDTFSSYVFNIYKIGSTYPIFCNFDIYSDSSFSSFFYRTFTPPRFGETQESINNLAGGYCLIFPGSVDPDSKIVFKLVRRFGEEGEKDRVVYQTDLTWSSSFYKSVSDSNGVLSEFWYEIPYENMYSFEKGQKFTFMLEYSKSADDLNTRVVQLESTIGSITTADKTQDDINSGFNTLNSSISSGFADLKVEFEQSTDKIVGEQQKTQKALKENTETNKNIFQRIGELLSYINPLSENFFAYKLIDLLLDALKSLFIPSNEFFSNYFSELNDWFSDRFGFLYYPLELFFDLCNRFLNINFDEPIINIPEIKEPATNMTLIHATQYNFNSLLEQGSLKTVHDIYLIIVDAIIYVGLVILLYNKYEEVMTK